MVGFAKRLTFYSLMVSSFVVASESQTHREPQFENAYANVWKTVIVPHQPLHFHRHDCSRVVIALKGGCLTKIEETGERSQLLFETGKAYWLLEDPPGTLHGDINESNESIELMVIEFKKSGLEK